MNKWKIGAGVEKLYCESLEELGFWTRRFPKTRYYEQDLFGTDIIAIGVGEIRFIQVKSNKDRFPAFDKKVEKELKRLYARLPDNCSVWWAGYNRKKKEWKLKLIR